MADALASLGQGSSNANVAKIAIEQRPLSGITCPVKTKMSQRDAGYRRQKRL